MLNLCILCSNLCNKTSSRLYLNFKEFITQRENSRSIMKVPVGCMPKIVPFYLKSIMGHKVVNSEVILFNAGKISLKVINETPPLKWYTN